MLKWCGTFLNKTPHVKKVSIPVVHYFKKPKYNLFSFFVLYNPSHTYKNQRPQPSLKWLCLQTREWSFSLEEVVVWPVPFYKFGSNDISWVLGIMFFSVLYTVFDMWRRKTIFFVFSHWFIGSAIGSSLASLWYTVKKASNWFW